MKTRLSTRAALFVVACVAACGHANGSISKENNQTQTQTNKKTVTAVFEQLFVKKDLGAIDRYFAEPYLQHDPLAPSGLDAFHGFAQAVVSKPQFEARLARIFADGDLVVTHAHYAGLGPAPVVAFDLFRLEDGNIVEHWDGIQQDAPANPSGHTMLDGETEVRDDAKTDENTTLVKNMIDSVFIRGETNKLPMFVDEKTYIQHNPTVGDGLENLKGFLADLHEKGISFGFTKLHHIVAEGNFVFTLAEGHFGDAPKAFYDLWRIENGKVVEHWDVIQDVPPNTASGLPIF